MKRFTDTDKWRDSFFQALKPEFKLALVYLYDNCDNAGVFDPNLGLADYCIGMPIDWQGFRKAMDGRLVVLESGKWHLSRFISFQFGKLSEDSKPHQQVLRLMENHGLSKGYPKGIHTLKDKDKDKDKDTAKDTEMIRAERLFNRRPDTVWGKSELKAWEASGDAVRATTEDEWKLLEWFYARPPSEQTYRRRDLATLINNWGTEIDRARQYRAAHEVSGRSDMKYDKPGDY